jgi:hypothetical protein
MAASDSGSCFRGDIMRVKIGSRTKIILGSLTYCFFAAVIAFVMYSLSIHSSAWTTLDADRFHDMARMIIGGFEPYVSYIDPKPPLLFFTVTLMDIVSPAGSIDILVITVINVIIAGVIWKIGWEDYGSLAGFTAGFIYLVSAVFTEGYFLFSEQFAVLFLLLAYIAARRSFYVVSGLLTGLAAGFKQYALLMVIPLLYLMRSRSDRCYHRFILPVAIVTVAMFAALFLAYGTTVGWSAIYYTYLVAPDYITGNVTTFSTYVPETPLAYVANLLLSVAIVLPVVVFALASAVHTGLRDAGEKTLGLIVLVFFSTLIIRQYLHYWILIMPFLALFACREFADKDRSGTG